MDMTLREFASRCENELNTAFETRGVDITLRTITTVKTNNIQKVGLTLAPQNGISPIMYLEEPYNQYKDGLSFDSIKDLLENKFESIVREQFSLGDFDICNYDQMKHLISSQLVNYKSNQSALSTQPHRRVQDLALRYRIEFDVPTTDQGQASAVITNQMLETWGITESDLFDMAKESQLPTQQPVLNSLEDIIISFSDDPPNYLGGDALNPNEIYTLSNENKMNGAIFMCHSDTLKEIGEQFGENYSIIPSSVHELLLVPDSMNLSPTELTEMVYDVNTTHVEPDEILSYNIYSFDRELEQVNLHRSEFVKSKEMER